MNPSHCAACSLERHEVVQERRSPARLADPHPVHGCHGTPHTIGDGRSRGCICDAKPATEIARTPGTRLEGRLDDGERDRQERLDLTFPAYHQGKRRSQCTADLDPATERAGPHRGSAAPVDGDQPLGLVARPGRSSRARLGNGLQPRERLADRRT